MKSRALPVILALITLLSLTVFSAGGVELPMQPVESFSKVYGDLEYMLDDGEITIINCYDNATGEMVIPSDIDGYPVTRIEEYSFEFCASLESVIIPDTVTSIGDGAFRFCASLEGVSIPDSVISFGNAIFDNSPSVTVYCNKDSVAHTYATQNGISFTVNTTIILQGSCGDGLTYILDSDGTLSIYGTGDMTDWTQSDAPWYNNRLDIKKVVINDGVTSIGNFAFLFCESITSITIPDSVTKLGTSSLSNCTGLASITLPDSIVSIGDSAFYRCKNLTTITIPKSVKWIDSSAFCNCDNLTSINVDANNPNYSSDNGVLYNKDKTEIVFYPAGIKASSFTVPSGVTAIGMYAFWKCYDLTVINLPDSLTSIGYGVFYKCTGLTTVTIPDGVTSIGDFAFRDCINITSINIPDSVTSIGDDSFYGCTSLTVYCKENSYAHTYAINNSIKYELIEVAKAEFIISSAEAMPGDTVKLTLSLKTNAEVNSIALSDFEYDPEVLDFIGFEDYDAVEELCLFSFFDEDEEFIVLGFEETVTFDGKICDLVFKVKGDAEYTVATVSATPIVKKDSQVIFSSVIPGELNIHLIGDIDGDGDLDLDDASYLFGSTMLPQYFPISYNGNMDFTADGIIDIQDAIALFRYSMLPDIYPLN